VVQPTVKYAQPAGVYRNRGGNKFEDVSAKLGRALQKAVVARGAAYADYDNDGDLDLAISVNGGAGRLLRNDNGNQNDSLRVRLVGNVAAKSNRDAIGARVTMKTNKGAQLTAMVKTGSSYLSQSELPLTFGLGKPESGKTASLEIIWPSGRKETVPNVQPNRFLTITEGKGITADHPLTLSPKP